MLHTSAMPGSGPGRGGVSKAGGYDVFISYNRKADSQVAIALQRGLRRFGKPWYRLRALNVYRDQTNMAASPRLRSSIENALQASRSLVLIASPEAAVSFWVGEELRWWLERRSLDDLLIVLADGTIDWDRTRERINRDRTDSLPVILIDQLDEEPLWVDLRSVHGTLTLRNPAFRDAVATLAAALRGQPKERLIGEDRRQQRRFRWVLAAVAGTLAVLGVLSVSLFGQRQGVARQRTAVAASRLADEADALRSTDPLTSLRLAIAALRLDGSDHARSSLTGALTDGDYLGVLTHYPDYAVEVAFSPKVGILATSGSGTVDLWDMRDRVHPRRLARLPLPASLAPGVLGVAFSPDGRTLALGRSDGVLLWSLRDPHRPSRLLIRGSTARPTGFPSFSPDGRIMATLDSKLVVHLWGIQRPGNPRPLGTLPPTDVSHVKYPIPATFSPNGRIVATGVAGSTLRLWDLSQPTHPVRRGDITTGRFHATCAAFSPDGQTVVVGNASRGADLWDVRDPVRPRSVAGTVGGGSSVDAVTFSPDGRTLATASIDSAKTLLWDVRDRLHPRAVATLAGPTRSVYALSYSPDGRTLAGAGAEQAPFGKDESTVRLWDVTEVAHPGRLVTLAPERFGSTSMAFSPDARLLATASGGRVRLWDVASLVRPRLVGMIPVADASTELGFTPDGRTLVTGSSQRTSLWDVRDPARPRRLADFPGSSDNVTAAALRPDGDVLATGNAGRVLLWDIHDRQGPRQIGAISAGSSVSSISFSPDGKALATASAADQTVLLWDLHDLNRAHKIAALAYPEGALSTPAFSPDGQALAFGASLWDISNPANPTQLAGITSVGAAVARFSPSGRLLVTGGNDGRSQLWKLDEPRRPKLVTQLTGFDNVVVSIAISRDGHAMAISANDGTIGLWDLREQVALLSAPLERACTIARRALNEQEWARYATALTFQDTCA